MYYIKSTDESFHNERRRREFPNWSSVLLMWYINEQECFIAIVTHMSDTNMLFL